MCSYGYHSNLDSFDVINIKIAPINLFLLYSFYIRMYVKNILNLAHASQRQATSNKLWAA